MEFKVPGQLFPSTLLQTTMLFCHFCLPPGETSRGWEKGWHQWSEIFDVEFSSEEIQMIIKETIPIVAAWGKKKTVTAFAWMAK